MGLLDRVTVEAPQQPSRVYLYAAEKWGKTSFAAHAPKPIFLMTSGETGLLDLINYGQIEPTPHFPEDFKRWPDLLDAIEALATEKHDYKTLVLDTANGAERLLADYVLHTEFNGVMGGKNGYASYGKGDLACIPYWAELLRRLDRVRNERSMSILLLAHSKIKSVNNPEGDDYDQLRPEGIDKLWPLTHKWASVIGAGTYKVVVKDDKAAGGRERIVKLQASAAVVSGNRYGLPEQVACGGSSQSAWNAFAKVIADAKRAAAKKAAAPAAKPAGPPPSPVQAPAPQPAAPSAPAAQEEGEQGSDFTPTAARPNAANPATKPATVTAPTASVPSAAGPAASASAATAPATAATDPAPKPMPAAERRTAPLRAPAAPGSDVPGLLSLLHQLGLSWPEVRDRAEGKGGELAEACGIYGTPGLQLPELGLSLRSKLFAECEARVQEKRARAAKRAANKAAREAVAS